MEPEIKTALVKAAAKLGIGLSLVVAVIGIRMISVSPEGVSASIEKLDDLEEEMAAEASHAISLEFADSPREIVPDDSIASRLNSGFRERFSGLDSDARDSQARERLVSCRLGSSTQFMRADDCAMRGGQSTDVSRKR